MLETHPFPPFLPKRAKYLLLGSFTGRGSYDWYYGTKRNQFWQIIEQVYGLKLNSKAAQQKLFTRLKISITDIIYQCERVEGNNLDSNLINIVYNIPVIQKIISSNKIGKIYFSSRFVEKKFRKIFPDVSIPTITLPSPSPRYAAITKAEKIKRYQALLPSLPKN